MSGSLAVPAVSLSPFAPRPANPANREAADLRHRQIRFSERWAAARIMTRFCKTMVPLGILTTGLSVLTLPGLILLSPVGTCRLPWQERGLIRSRHRAPAAAAAGRQHWTPPGSPDPQQAPADPQARLSCTGTVKTRRPGMKHPPISRGDKGRGEMPCLGPSPRDRHPWGNYPRVH